MRTLTEREVGVMFWAGRDTLPEIASLFDIMKDDAQGVADRKQARSKYGAKREGK